MTRYLSVAETAKLLRQSLKETFPGVKFSVKSRVYAGGGSIDVSWTDGPTSKQVEAVSGLFEGAYFDGMIDYKGYRYHELDGVDTQFGANFVFEHRSYSDQSVEDELDIQRLKYGVGVVGGVLDRSFTVEDFKRGNLYSVPVGGAKGWDTYWNLQSVVNRGLAETTYLTREQGPLPSATLARIKFTGDDGYGQGTVGRNGSGGDKAAQGSEELRELNS